MTTLRLDDPRDNIKMLQETLCVAQNILFSNRLLVGQHHIDRLQRMIDECERQRPLGSNGKHGNLHTDTCGCEDK